MWFSVVVGSLFQSIRLISCSSWSGGTLYGMIWCSKKVTKIVDSPLPLWDSAITHGNNYKHKMRTKMLLLSAAAVAAGLLSASAQVYSVNVVGYVNLVTTNQWTMLNNPLNNVVAGTTNNTIQGVLSNAPTTSLFYYWTGTGFGNTLKNGANWLVNRPLAPGGGGLLKLPGAGPFLYTNVFVGEVLQGNLQVPYVGGGTPSGGYSLISSKVPQAGTLEVLGLTSNIVGQATLYKWRGTPAGYNTFLKIAAGTSFLGSPTVNVGEAFILFTTNQGNWNRSFSVQ